MQTARATEDIAAQIHATSGVDKAFAIAGPNGSDRVASVTRGADDRQGHHDGKENPDGVSG